MDLLKLAEESYIVCCKLKPEYGSYWYDLGLSYFNQFLAASEQACQVGFLNKAKDCFVRAVNIEPENAIFWNILGIYYSFNGS